VLEAKLTKSGEFSEVNQIFWTDLYESIGASEQIFYRRSYTLLNSALRLTEADDYLSATILSRSLLELAIWHVYHSSIFDATIREINKEPNKQILDAVEIQQLVLKLIWGTNRKGVQEEIKQQKVLKICEKVAKSIRYDNKTEMSLESIYDILREYVHPNVEGNNLFLDFDINAGLKPVSEVKLNIDLNQNYKKAVNPIETILMALTWCMSATAFASEKYGSSRRLIVEKFNLNPRENRKLH
jgi:hypothetical protein